MLTRQHGAAGLARHEVDFLLGVSVRLKTWPVCGRTLSTITSSISSTRTLCLSPSSAHSGRVTARTCGQLRACLVSEYPRRYMKNRSLFDN